MEKEIKSQRNKAIMWAVLALVALIFVASLIKMRGGA